MEALFCHGEWWGLHAFCFCCTHVTLSVWGRGCVSLSVCVWLDQPHISVRSSCCCLCCSRLLRIHQQACRNVTGVCVAVVSAAGLWWVQRGERQRERVRPLAEKQQQNVLIAGWEHAFPPSLASPTAKISNGITVITIQKGCAIR